MSQQVLRCIAVWVDQHKAILIVLASGHPNTKLVLHSGAEPHIRGDRGLRRI